MQVLLDVGSGSQHKLYEGVILVFKEYIEALLCQMEAFLILLRHQPVEWSLLAALGIDLCTMAKKFVADLCLHVFEVAYCTSL